ncbi:hypothetical protein WOLCODRAFT_25490 [Wolfiporia cocos MD-104 SS10]|uniref:Uncharacterized protein n=1 Tax=Wolfiporia cocos (strain MD-104) TaxID=742152 RepID=A0A2H3JMD8_WOLCO|nr:hypothetical protein WOLCODRAFT_25490 [Wolfiporia cocos MD-104 SS10]
MPFIWTTYSPSYTSMLLTVVVLTIHSSTYVKLDGAQRDSRPNQDLGPKEFRYS